MTPTTGSSPVAEPARPSVLLHGASLALMTLLGLLAFAPALHGPFIFDDQFHIVGNEAIRTLGLGALRSGYQETRPLYMLTLALNYHLSGLDPLPYRAVNLGLHLLIAFLLYAFLHRMRAHIRAGRALLAPSADVTWPLWPLAPSLLFLLHPLTTEGVSYINSRSGLLATFLGLASLHLYLSHHGQGSAPRRALLYLASWLLQLSAILSKEMGAVFPVLLSFYLLAFRCQGRLAELRAHARGLVGLASTWLALPLLFLWASNPHEKTIGFHIMAWTDHLLTQTKVWAMFLLLALAPVKQNFDYHIPISASPLDPLVLASLLLLLGLAVGAWYIRRRALPVAFGLLWFALALLPTNSLIPFKDFAAERHLYASLLGLAMAGGWGGLKGLQWLRERSSPLRGALLGALTIYLISLGALTALRNEVLADPLALWRDTVEASPQKSRPHLNLAIHLIGHDQWEEGYQELMRAYALDPQSHGVLYNLGIFHERRGEWDQSYEFLRRAVRAYPTPSYRASLANSANMWGTQMAGQGQIARAKELFEEALAVQDDHGGARFNLAMMLVRQERPEEAVVLLREVLRRKPDHAKARDWLERLEARSGPGTGRY